MKKFKDKCDNCNKFDYLIGFNGKCLCSNCIKNYTKNKEESIDKEKKSIAKQLSIFDKF